MKQPELQKLLKDNNLYVTKVSKSGDCYLVYKEGNEEDLVRLEQRLTDVLKRRDKMTKMLIVNKGVKDEEIFIAFKLKLVEVA